MTRQETPSGEPAWGFPTTAWSEILTAGPKARAGMEYLCRTYWKPVYIYVRIRWKKSVEDAKDLTQAFFIHLLEKDVCSRVHPERGHFRSYLKAALNHFVINAHAAAQARGPKGRLFSIEASPRELEALGAGASDAAADQAYEREWFRGVLESSIADLEQRLRRDGKDVYFAAFRLYCLDMIQASKVSKVHGTRRREPPTYEEVARNLGLRAKDVQVYLTHCRRMVRRIIREKIRQYAENDLEIDAELAEILES